jgi:hypothetical protein
MLAVALLSVACSHRRTEAPKDFPTNLTLPGARGPKVTLATEDAMLVYPDPETMDRDPFLLLSEERPEEAAAYESHNERKGRRRPAAIIEVSRPTVLKQLHETVTGIIIGPRNTFFFQGKLFEEGDTIPNTNWVVASITASAINLRSKDGQTDRLAFVRESRDDFQFKHSR